MKNLLAAIALSMLLFSCGGGENEPMEETEVVEESVRDAAPENVALEISAADAMEYSTTALSAPANTEFTITFSHTGQLTIEKNMGHNFVLLAPGSDVAAFGMASMNQEGYMPEDQSNVIAATKMLNGGESETLTIGGLEPGEYPYVCTFPGHFGMMKGILTVN